MALSYNIQYLRKNNSMNKKQENRNDSYEVQTKKCKQFLLHYQDHDLPEPQSISYLAYGKHKYLIQLQKISNQELKTLEIYIQDLQQFFGKEDQRSLVESFVSNTYRYIQIFTNVASQILPERNTPLSPEQTMKNKFQNVLNMQRNDNIQSQDQRGRMENEKLPLKATKKFDVSIAYGPNAKYQVLPIRQLKSGLIGSLVVCKAIVVRVSDVKPLMVMATYSCDSCGCENYQIVNTKQFTPLIDCTSKRCKQNKMNGKLTFISGSSKFIAYQQLKIQQTSDQLVEGNIPRTFNVHLKGQCVKSASPGDVVLIQGILLPTRRDGFRHKGDLVFDAFIQSYKVIRQKKKYIQMAITNEVKQKIQKIRHQLTDQDLFSKLAKSISPQIYGLQTVKKALLLLMVGGVTKQTHDNMRIRGQINIALIGDPGVAKSQLLKHIAYLSPRGIYTTGKGSSGVGLTAAIIKDPITNQIMLEAGALVLADMGICCIDQFDKMDENDRTAIHEVMQQQTVSIAKAGITTSLNARTSILAAANPLYGRYNKKQTPHKNINLPAALLSRFDLIFVLLDVANKAKDIELAMHICDVHQKLKAPDMSHLLDPQLLRTYIAMAKEYQPTINEQLYHQLTKKYLQMRKQQSDLTKQGYSYTTTRTLLGLIRLCQARAKLRFSNEVSSQDVQQCLELIEQSQKNVQMDKNVRKPRNDNISAIYGIIKDICLYDEKKEADLSIIQKRIIARGYKIEDLSITLEQYEKANVVSRMGNKVMLIQ